MYIRRYGCNYVFVHLYGTAVQVPASDRVPTVVKKRDEMYLQKLSVVIGIDSLLFCAVRAGGQFYRAVARILLKFVLAVN